MKWIHPEVSHSNIQVYIIAILSFMIWPLAADAAGIGPCHFSSTDLAFEGTPAEQARCLLRPVAKWGHVQPAPADLPPTLAEKVGTEVDVPTEALSTYLEHLDLTSPAIGGPLDAPVSRARDGRADAPLARYFVIHDTSAPWLGDKPFPTDLDSNPGINRLAPYARPGAVAHIFVNREGASLQGHDLSTPWRATKLEKAIGLPAKGLFLHVELIQPRRRDPGGGLRNDAVAPTPGFTPAQYERLALLYVVASTRAGTWLVPAFHAVLDEGISDGHDDPQHFDLAEFDAALAKTLQTITKGLK